MTWLDKLEKRLRPFAVPNLTIYLIAGQTIVYVLALSRPGIRDAVALIPARVLAGEAWRVVTFLFYPPITNALFAFFAWYLLYLMGDALEHQWGTARYNIFLLIGYLATVAASFLTPNAQQTNFYLLESIFLAFAYLFPDFQILLFFILPVKVKWLALLAWIQFFLTFAFGGWTARMAILAAVLNFLLFFGRDLWLKMRAGRLRMERQAQRIKHENQPIHRCVVCGVTDTSDPGMDFRYCSRCADSPCYCRDHIRDHTHRTATGGERSGRPPDEPS